MYKEQRGKRMNESEKERLIKKDIESVENRVRHAFNQGYEMGLKESRSEIPNTCDDAVSRAIVQEEITKSIALKENPYQLWYRIQALPSVSPQQRTGRWEEKDGYDGDVYYDCSVCGESWASIEGTPKTNGMKYCPNCGAKMVEPQESEG